MKTGGLQGLFIHALQTEANAISQPLSVSSIKISIIVQHNQNLWKTNSLCYKVNQFVHIKGRRGDIFLRMCVDWWKTMWIVPPPPRGIEHRSCLFSISVAPTLYCMAEWGQPGLAVQTTMCRKRPGGKKPFKGLFTRQMSKESKQRMVIERSQGRKTCWLQLGMQYFNFKLGHFGGQICDA